MTRLSLVTFFVLVLTACGGGGGGGGGGSSIKYTGISAKAALTSESSESFANTAISEHESSSAVGLSVSTQSSNTTGLQGLVAILADFAFNNKFEESGNANAAAIQTDRGNLYGDCGGSVYYSLTADSVTGEFSGSFDFNNYDNCSGDGMVDGRSSVSGIIDLYYGEIEEITMNQSRLSVITDVGKSILSGTISIEYYGGDSFESTVNARIQNADGVIFQFVNYVTDFNGNTYPDSYQVNGRVYHPDYGYVDVETIGSAPLRQYSYNDYPHAGQIRLTGEIGGLGSDTTALVTMIDANSYTIDLDSDGDLAVDTILNCTWEPDQCL